ncbi:DNA-directed RNA polymerase III subunit RPC7-like [Rhipicephalus sanguineus]|uniref:DNA-directed RNA polymerase III subunit RPC7-like n=1 Tax=Rhipicephalus sanguineus TaxID=34632 RepID=UPI00189633B6|nr:DNA-directed RNA polymerase III subunit RPC7-like [Rhipicephalus sanguineus]
MLNSARLGLTAEELNEVEHSEPPPLYPPWQCPAPPLLISEEDKHLASALAEQRRKFTESAFYVPPHKKPRSDGYCRQVIEPPRVNYDSSYFPGELKVPKKAKKTKKSSQISVAQIDIEQELLVLQAPKEEDTICESDNEDEEESTEKSSESGSEDEAEDESDDEEMEEDTDYVHNYYDDYEEDGAFNEDNLDDGASF